MVDRILVGTDGSEAATQAVAYALNVAEATNGTLHALTVISPNGSSQRFGVDTVEAIDDAAEALGEELNALRRGRAIEIVGDVRRGQPSDILLEYAREEKIDLIILGKHGHGGFVDRLLGSTAERLTRQTDIPVLLVPREATRSEVE